MLLFNREQEHVKIPEDLKELHVDYENYVWTFIVQVHYV